MLNNMQQERVFTGQHMPPSPQGCRCRRLNGEKWWLTVGAVVGLILPANSAFGSRVGALVQSKVADRTAIKALGSRSEPRRSGEANSSAATLRGTPLSILMRLGWQVRGFSLRENALVRGANGHVQRKPPPRILNGVPSRGGGHPAARQRLLAATQPVLQPASPREEPASPGEVTTAIKSKFRSAKLFTDAWYRDHPTAWRPSSAAATAAALTTWDAVSEWLTVTGAPVYYGYGDNVVVTDTEVYFSGLRAASLFDYAQAAAELAAAGAKEPAKTARWRSLGTFALVPPQRFNARAYVTLSVSRVGFVRGTYVDALTKQPVPIIGAVDRAYQRVAWTTGEKGTTVFDTGLDNLTRATAPLLVHYETKRTEQWLTVRVRADDGQSPPATPPDEK
jgi:hypothetical protein